ncbi:MAG TPA: Spy/CpxP family protein refolding chaperone [Pseudolabrys sp.]|nr:Spy/CpxP family protein refolding chaperone [Pseudolabrys sp.]
MNGGNRLTPQTARQGRFAARFASARADRRDRHRRRFEAVAARRAWRHGHRAAFVGWYGPVFWPYAYSDIFDYTFWPSGYDDGYWAYAYDDLFDGVFWGESGPPETYAYAAPAAGASPSGSGGAVARTSSAGVRQLCNDPGSGVTAWPFAEINKAVAPTSDQQALLDDLKAAAQKAADVFKASCPSANAYPRTPPGRLRAMMARLLATLQAVQTVRPPLEKFYESLSDEQKARFNDIGPKQNGNNSDQAEQAQASASDCKQAKPGLSNLPIDKIEQVVKPTDQQEDSLSNLENATDKAVSILQAACPDETPLTPVGRLDAMQKRLQAMIDAAKTVEAPLDDFYASLSDEQKARFNKLGREVAQNGE